MTELEIACAQVFRRKGKSRMPEKDFVFAVSLDFKWYTPKEAQRLLDMGLGAGVLAVEEGMVVPKFDYKNIDIPKGFTPAAELLQQPVQPRGMLLDIVDMISQKKGMDAKDIISMVNQTQDSLGIEIEVAALVVARNLGVDISEFIDSVEEDLGNKCRK